MSENSQKILLNGYVGVKFKAIQVSAAALSDTVDFLHVFKKNGDRLNAYGMTPANGGNISVRKGNGFFITASGCNLGSIESNELISVERCDLEEEKVYYRGPRKPSSESIMHWLIYQNRLDAGAIIHAHDEPATRSELITGKVEESEREEPYGTVELAHMAIRTFERTQRIIVLKNHGYVAVGPDLDRVCDLIVETHLKLVGEPEFPAH